MFPTISKDGSKLAFVDNEFKAVYVANSQGLRIIYEERGRNCVFSPVWNQNLEKDILYVCIGTSLNSHQLEIFAICNSSGPATGRKVIKLTVGGYNNAYPSSNPDGDKFVFRSAKDGLAPHKNLYIMLHSDNEQFGEHSNKRHRDNEEFEEPWQTRLTKGKWTDTHCQWSPNGDWIVFSSTRDNRLDPRHFSVYLVKAFDPTVLIRVTSTGGDLGGQINHPVFSLDGRSIAVTVHLVAASVDPVSLPNFKRGVQHYSDIFIVDVHPDDVEKKMKINVKLKLKNKTENEKLMGFRFRRITHSRYECGTPAWTMTFTATDTNTLWNMLPDMEHMYALGVSTRSASP